MIILFSAYNIKYAFNRYISFPQNQYNSILTGCVFVDLPLFNYPADIYGSPVFVLWI